MKEGLRTYVEWMNSCTHSRSRHEKKGSGQFDALSRFVLDKGLYKHLSLFAHYDGGKLLPFSIVLNPEISVVQLAA